MIPGTGEQIPGRPDEAGLLAANLRTVEHRLELAAAAAGRSRDELTLIAVSKTRPAGAIAALAELGVRDFGESRWQELGPKVEEIAGSDLHWRLDPRWPPDLRWPPDFRWHFLGRLQRNKARAVGAAVHVVHSLDRGELCGPLSRGALAAGRTIDVFVQVSLDGDPTRGGASTDAVDALADEVVTSEGLRLVGLMAVAPQGAPPRPAFARLRELSERLQIRHPDARSISAGMSGDVEDAIAEGATHLRIGTALFGSRA